MDTLWYLASRFTHWLSHNQILSGGFALMSFGGLVAWLVAECRKVPGEIVQWCQRRAVVTVDVANDDPLFGWISVWLSEQPYSKRARALSASTEILDYGEREPPRHQNQIKMPRILLSPAPGLHIFVYKRRVIWLTRSRKEGDALSDGKQNGGIMLLASRWQRETYTIKVVGRSQIVVRKLLEDVQQLAFERRHRERRTEVFMPQWSRWTSLGERRPRAIETVFLPEGKSEEIVGRIDRFLHDRDWYAQRGIPWRLGYLLFGLPGSGKTSLIAALTGHFKTNLYILSVSSAQLADDEVLHLLGEVPPRSFVLLEDVDAAFEQRKKSKDVDNRLSFSGLLNGLDGVASNDGIVVFMTTNHRDKLDPALIRPGRADEHIEFKHADAFQAESMYRAFFPDAQGVDDFGGRVERAQMTMAEVQQHLLAHRDSAVRALNLPARELAIAATAG